MLRLKRGTETVPDLFTWKFPQDGYVASAYDIDSWFSKIDKHYKDNEYPQPANWREIAENDLCRRLSGEWCTGGGPRSFVNTRFTLDDFIRGTKVLAPFVLTGNVVSKEVAESRALICSRCPLNVRVPGCASCSQMANVVADAKGGGTTKYDNLLQSCAICLCSNEAQIWIPIEYLRKGVTDVMMGQFKEFNETGGECWKAKELAELDAASQDSSATTS
jgi:hypothetical protein